MIYLQKTKGIAVIIAIITVTAALLIVLGISDIMVGQLKIATNAGSSFVALYAADTGLQCALYYLKYGELDSNNRGIPGTSFWSPETPCNGDQSGSGCGSNIQCGGFTNDASGEPSGPTVYPSSVSYMLNDSAGPVGTRDEFDDHIFTFKVKIDSRDYSCTSSYCQTIQPKWQKTPELCADVQVVSRHKECAGGNYDETIITSAGKSSCTDTENTVNRTLEVRISDTSAGPLCN